MACNGQNTGSATASVSGGTAPYTYAWSNGQNSATISGLTAGTYTVTVTDNNGCTASNVYVLTTASAIVVNPSQTTIACHGGTSVLLVSPTGGSGTYTYSWSHDGGNTTNTATVTAGVYYATVTDSAGCSVTYCFVVNQPSALACGITQVNVTCNGLTTGSATVNGTGGTGLYTYAWSNGQTMQTATGLGAGTYTATVTDGAGCTSTCTVTITEPTALSVGTSNTNVSCVNPTGTAMAVVGGGTPPYTYLWSNGATTSAISGLAAGSYTVTVNDANGCGPISATAVIGAPTPVTCTASVTQSISCSGYQNGQATVVPGGGNGVYNVIWNTAPAQTTLTATGMGAGTYTVTVFDSDGCSSQCTVTVTEPGPLVYSFSTGGAVCQGGNNGTATITPVGGTPYTVGNAYVYLWSNGQTTQTATGLSSGTVYVTVTDSLGCSLQAAIILTQSAALNCNTTCTPTSCGQALGTATVNVFGGTPPYVYQWSNGGTNGINTGLVAGVYTVLITDASGCTTTCTAMVGQAAAIQYSLQVTNALCNGGNGSISITNLNGGSAHMVMYGPMPWRYDR
ncbi:MAG: SprB repeat-containing protein [Bacteroidetes bacterium]|nr:SprB repeat-containing protein [Bacteroidota bacterium]